MTEITRVIEKQTPPENVAAQRREQYAQWLTKAEALAYYDWLKQRFKAQIKVPRPSADLISAVG